MPQRGDLDMATDQLLVIAARRAEWLIGWLRLGISSCLAIVFFFAMTRAPVPMTDMLQWQIIYALGTMGTYLLLGLFALALIWFGHFRPWMVWPSALGDCLFILVSTALALSNTGLPGLYVYVFPTVWLIPIVLACGALRFNPMLQGAMAFTLAVGLLAILTVTGRINPTAGENEALSFLFDIPPNLMRTAMIAVAAVVLVVASMRIRALLWESITEAKARGMLTRFLPAQLGQIEADELDALRAGNLVQMAVVFVDIRGFTRLAEGMAPQDLSQMLNGYRAIVSAQADRHGGIVDKFIGDGAMVVFENHDGSVGTRVLGMVRGLSAAVFEWNPSLRIGIGAHVGDVFAGVVGAEGRLEYTVLGDVVNVASRLEAATKDHDRIAIVSRTLWEIAKTDDPDWQPMPHLQLPGRQEPMECVGLRGPHQEKMR